MDLVGSYFSALGANENNDVIKMDTHSQWDISKKSSYEDVIIMLIGQNFLLWSKVLGLGIALKNYPICMKKFI